MLNIAACVACPERDDEYLTRNSVNFHTHMGWRAVGEFCKCGYKFGRWYNVAWLDKIIARALRPVPGTERGRAPLRGARINEPRRFVCAKAKISRIYRPRPVALRLFRLRTVSEKGIISACE